MVVRNLATKAVPILHLISPIFFFFKAPHALGLLRLSAKDVEGPPLIVSTGLRIPPSAQLVFFAQMSFLAYEPPLLPASSSGTFGTPMTGFPDPALGTQPFF